MNEKQKQLNHYEGLKAAKNLLHLLEGQLADGSLKLRDVAIKYPKGEISLTGEDYAKLAIDAVSTSISDAKEKYGVK